MRLVRYTYPSFRTLAPARFQRSPWSGLEGEIDRLFETALSGLGTEAPADRFPVDLYEDKDNTYVRAELPGVNREDINVEMVDGYLTIVASRKATEAEGQAFSWAQDGTRTVFTIDRRKGLVRSIAIPEIGAANPEATPFR